MSASTWMDRSRRRGPSAEPRRDTGKPPEKRAWVGVDLSHLSSPRTSRAFLPLLVVALLVALGVASLRIDLIRTRYALAAAIAEEKQLIKDQRALIVRKRTLRDPVALAVMARERGFRAAESVHQVRDPMPPATTAPRRLEATISAIGSDATLLAADHDRPASDRTLPGEEALASHDAPSGDQ